MGNKIWRRVVEINRKIDGGLKLDVALTLLHPELTPANIENFGDVVREAAHTIVYRIRLRDAAPRRIRRPTPLHGRA